MCRSRRMYRTFGSQVDPCQEIGLDGTVPAPNRAASAARGSRVGGVSASGGARAERLLEGLCRNVRDSRVGRHAQARLDDLTCGRNGRVDGHLDTSHRDAVVFKVGMKPLNMLNRSLGTCRARGWKDTHARGRVALVDSSSAQGVLATTVSRGTLQRGAVPPWGGTKVEGGMTHVTIEFRIPRRPCHGSTLASSRTYRDARNTRLEARFRQ